MALIKFGGGISEMRGAEGGVIYSRNAYGAYQKQKVSPVNPQSARQTAVRNLMSSVSQAWKDLSSGEKDQWDSFGDQMIRINRFGDQTSFTGFGAFVKANLNLVTIGESMIDTPVQPLTFPEEVYSFNTLATDQIIFDFTTTPIGTDFKIVADLTPAIYNGRRFVKNLYRLVKVSTVNQATSWDVTTSYVAVFGAVPNEDAVVFARLRMVDINSGWDNDYSIISGVVVAAA